MPKAINIRLPQLVFPKTCAVCLSPSTKEYGSEGTFTFGRRSHTIKIRVPMCDPHFEAASHKSVGERLVNGVAIIGGLFFGLICAIFLIWQWESGEGTLFKLFGGGIFGLGAFAIFWWIVSASIAPLFASTSSKEARNAVRITGYWPQHEVVRLEFKHESIAELVQKTN